MAKLSKDQQDFILKYWRFAHWLVKVYYRSLAEKLSSFDDANGFAIDGLIRAAQLYDPGKKCNFKYIRAWVLASLQKAVRQQIMQKKVMKLCKHIEHHFYVDETEIYRPLLTNQEWLVFQMMIHGYDQVYIAKELKFSRARCHQIVRDMRIRLQYAYIYGVKKALNNPGFKRRTSPKRSKNVYRKRTKRLLSKLHAV